MNIGYIVKRSTIVDGVNKTTVSMEEVRRGGLRVEFKVTWRQRLKILFTGRLAVELRTKSSPELGES